MTSPPQPMQERRHPPQPRHHHVPPGTGTFGMLLFLLALAILFAASMVLYIVFRITADGPPLGSVQLPFGLWVSTAIILISSYTMHRALQNVRHERQTAFRNAMMLTLLLGVAFLVVQTPSLMGLIAEHREQLALGEAGMPLYGLVFFLILVHAVHVVGGIAPLAVFTLNAHAGRYDHESYAPIKYMAMYWHFLDVVWILMFVMLLVGA
ncbi:heme-copper oxidase subunit III [Phycisphaerales bacterium AB-hyl4]|uniref:Heme-copper oxidase subunit III n=1 Tax=Natronomicrosphaera hydrolytica TaxID=3242702 RepID=A0ABV4U310_9BACT